MKCPVCSIRLLRGTYEDVQVRACPECRGILVEKHKADVIKRRGERSTEELKDEILQRLQPDTSSQLSCPRCRHMMRKSVVRCGTEFHIDSCPKCRVVWFDGGELAMFQLAYEQTDQGREGLEAQRRHREMTPEEQEAFEENVAHLPEEKPLLTELFEGLLFGRGRRRFSFWD